MVIFFVQSNNQGGLASWVAGTTGIMSLGIFFLSLFWGEKDIRRFDWFCLFGAFVAMIVWFFVKSPLWAVILATSIDTLGFAPTYRKTYLRPFEETLSSQVVSTTKHFVTLFALLELNFITGFYPAVLFVTNFIFVGMIIYRRKQKPGNFISRGLLHG